MEQHTLSTGAEDTVGTTGILEVSPNAVNSVPREARLGIGTQRSAWHCSAVLSVTAWHKEGLT